MLHRRRFAGVYSQSSNSGTENDCRTARARRKPQRTFSTFCLGSVMSSNTSAKAARALLHACSVSKPMG